MFFSFFIFSFVYTMGLGILRKSIGKKGETAPLPASQRPYLKVERTESV